MRLIIDVESFDGFQKRFWMNRGEMLQVGRSSQADVCVEADSQLLELHFAIEGSDDGWSLNAARGARVGINGMAVQRHKLNHGDTILAGQTEFHISIEVPADAAPRRAVVESPVVPVAPKVPATFSKSKCNSGVIELAINLNDTPLKLFLEKLTSSSTLYVAFNEQRFGGPLPSATKLTEDLFSQAPEEIRETDSLFIVQGVLNDAYLDLVTKTAQADAAVLFLSPVPLEEMLAEQKIGWAWYARPSILKQQLSLGSKELAKKLLASIEAALIISPREPKVVALVRPDAEAALVNAVQV